MTTIDYAKARETMVEQQVRPWDVLDVRVLEALSLLPREAFVPEAYRALAYADLPLPLGHDQLMLKPVVEGRVLQALLVAPSDEVLEIGTGSGYLTACLGRLGRDVLSLELHPELAEAAKLALAANACHGNIRIEVADALQYDTTRRFDAICVGGAVDRVPSQFARWLRPGGRMFVVHGRAPAMTALLVQRPATQVDDAAFDVNALHVQTLFETDLPYLVGAAPVPQFKL